MRDKATLAKARKELEDRYSGIPDESVNLTFQDFAELRLNQITPEKKNPNPILLEHISELKSTTQASPPSPLTKPPSLDFDRAFQASNEHNHHMDHASPYRGHNMNHHLNHHPMDNHHDLQHGRTNHAMHHGHASRGLETSLGANYDHDVSGVSGVSMASSMYNQQERGGRRRPGIPHSNICTLCSTYIYIFRHRCLVCGRVYCSQCVVVGMEEMTEGRKCVQCFGRRFSQRCGD